MDGSILLAATDPDDINLVRHALQQGHIASPLAVVTDGDAAVAWLAGEARAAGGGGAAVPLLVLLDLWLPHRPGLDVLRWVRRQASLVRTPIVMMASPDQPDDLRQAYDLGASAYLMKPLAASDLMETVKTAILYRLLLYGQSSPRP